MSSMSPEGFLIVQNITWNNFFFFAALNFQRMFFFTEAKIILHSSEV